MYVRPLPAYLIAAGLVWGLLRPVAWADDLDQHPLTDAQRTRLLQPYHDVLESTPAPDDQQPTAIPAHSRRGDALLFLGQFQPAVEEYQAMVRLNPKLDASHWRLGIALYFAGRPKQAAEQFDKYHSFDDVDRENGIWRYLCHYRAWGPERAAKELLRYSKDDREPFPMVYRLFDGSVTPNEARQQIPDSLEDNEREKRRFYTELYIGLLHVVRDEPDLARTALRTATASRWPRNTGFGPHYMWQVARLEYERLENSRDETQNSDPSPSP